MTNIFITFVPILYLIKFYLFGNFIIKKYFSNKDSYESIIFGFSIYIILINYFYFFFKQNIFIFVIFCLAISTIFLIFILLTNHKNLIEKKILLNFFLINFVVSLPAILYGNQFYVFRGNIYDTFSYLSTASIIANINFEGILSIISNNENYDSLLKEYANFIYARPSVQIFLASISKITNLNMFVNGFIAKSIILLLTFSSSYSFFFNYFKDEKLRLIYSLGFIFSFFFIYIYEIDAFAHLLSLPLLIIIFKNLITLETKKKDSLFLKCSLIAIYSSCSFIVYPEGSSAIFIPLFIYFLFVIMRSKEIKKTEKFKIIFLPLILFFLITLPLYQSTYNYLFFTQISNSLGSTKDFWGYYGAFILGKANPIYNLEVVNEIKDLWNENNSFYDLVVLIKNVNLESGNTFFLLNILPSIFGFYHLTTNNSNNFLNFFYIIFLTIINFYLIKVICVKLVHIFFKNEKINNFYKIILIYFIFLISYFTLTKNYWTVIKIYTFFSFFFYFFLTYDFKKNKFTNTIIVLILIFFPIYKYSENNNGIGRIDSFPSVMKTEFKLDNNWDLNYKKIKSCKNIKYNFNDKFKNLYVKIAINDFKYNFKKISSYDCQIIYKNQGFEIVNYE